MNPPESINNLSNENKPRQISYAALEKTSFLVNSIGFEGSTKNCVEVVRAERQLISLEGNMVDFEDESNPLFICDRDMASNLELHEHPGLKDVNWVDQQVYGICSILTPIVLNLLTP